MFQNKEPEHHWCARFRTSTLKLVYRLFVAHNRNTNPSLGEKERYIDSDMRALSVLFIMCERVLGDQQDNRSCHPCASVVLIQAQGTACVHLCKLHDGAKHFPGIDLLKVTGPNHVVPYDMSSKPII